MRIIKFSILGILSILMPLNTGMTTGIAEIQDTVITEFGVYTPYAVTITPQVPPYTIQPGLSNVAIPNSLEFTQDAEDKLEQNGFVAGAGRYLQIYDLYYEAQNREIPLFITSDAVLHAFHIFYDYTLRMLEVNSFYDSVVELSDLLIDKTLSYMTEATDGYIKERMRKNLAFLSVGRKLFDPDFDIPPAVDSLASAELDLIHNSPSPNSSPIFGYTEDYSQYIPRGHYTRNDLLSQYFRGMMWYGRMMFRLKPDEDDPENVPGKQETLQALCLTKALSESQTETQTAKELWHMVYCPTVFFVGKTDDLSANEYLPVIRDVYGKDITELSLEEIAQETLLEEFIEQAVTLRNPMINSSWIGDWEDFQIVTKGFRLMGQRFIPDSYMLYKLSHKSVEDRLFPKGLDIMAVLGSERALEILNEVYRQAELYPDYPGAIEALREYFGGMEARPWAQNLYWNWLYCLDPLLWLKGTGYPFFMQNSAWLDKDLNTALGSWAELRHDTILYAKQSYSERTSIETVDPTKGYVEPNPHLFARLAALAGFMRNGLTSRDLSLTLFSEKLKQFEGVLVDLKTIAEKELTNVAPSEQDYKFIINFPNALA